MSQTIIAMLVEDMMNSVANPPEHPPDCPQCLANSQQGSAAPSSAVNEQRAATSRTKSDTSVVVLAPRRNATTNLPPSYSTVIKMGPPPPPPPPLTRHIRSAEGPPFGPRHQVRSPMDVTFIRRIPPPSYADIDRTWSTDLSDHSSEQLLVLGPNPVYVWCSRCRTVVITTTQSQRSKYTHFLAATLCLFGCWPCCLVPYCMDTCKNTYHFCPECDHYFGMFMPW